MKGTEQNVKPIQEQSRSPVPRHLPPAVSSSPLPNLTEPLANKHKEQHASLFPSDSSIHNSYDV